MKNKEDDLDAILESAVRKEESKWRWRAANKDRIREKQAQWREKNKEHIKKYAEEYRRRPAVKARQVEKAKSRPLKAACVKCYDCDNAACRRNQQRQREENGITK